MKVFIFFILTTAVATAAPHAASVSDKRQHRSGKADNSSRPEGHHKPGEKRKHLSLKEIIHSVNNFTPTAEALQKEVQNVFMNEECNVETLCKAGNVLSAYNASDLGLRSEKDWRLPRRLLAYTKLHNCTIKGELESIPLLQFLEKVKTCVKKEFSSYPK